MMKKFNSIFSFLFLLIAIQAFSQKNQELLTIDGKPIYTDEFKRVYLKNIELVKDEKQKDLDNYLELFIGYKLKVHRAMSLGLDKDTKHIVELSSHRNQLAKNFLTNTEVTEQLIKEAYDRSQKEVKASHILIRLEEGASPQDTLVAYNKIKDIRERVLRGENFATLAETLSDDPSAKENKGSLGYFSAFRMIYPFENEAYNTKVGEISNIVKTRFGYHIIKVEGTRPHRGELTVAHIMLLSQNKTEDEKAKDKEKIQDIYKKIKQGENFEELAKNFSEDKSSANKGGLLNKFSSGQFVDSFEDVAFNLSSNNSISEPFETLYGWHIVKFIERHPVKTFEESKAELEQKLQKDERSKVITQSFINDLKKKYNVKKNDDMYSKILGTITDEFYDGEWKVPTDIHNYMAYIFSIDGKITTGEAFLGYLDSFKKNYTLDRNKNVMVEEKYDEFLEEKLKSHHIDNLEKENVEFGNIIQEYREGLLLFDLMEKEIWQKAKNDSIGQMKIFESKRDSYKWNKRIKAVVFSSKDKSFVEQALALAKEGKTVEEIRAALNKDNFVNIMTNDGTYESSANALPKGYSFTVGYSDIIQDKNYFYVVDGKEILLESNKTFEEAKSKVTSDYQTALEENWVSELKKQYTVKVNDKAFQQIKKDIKQKK
jgi:peptidyl-prolyl cis-trans isomerase SurA